MNVYLVFAGDAYYPGGGWGDWVGTYDTAQAALDAAKARTDDWVQVVDVATGVVVWERTGGG